MKRTPHCGACGKVAWMSVQCPSCERWFHRGCMNMDMGLCPHCAGAVIAEVVLEEERFNPDGQEFEMEEWYGDEPDEMP